MFDFIADLDEYFCETFANYDMICGLPGYRMPHMQGTKTDEYGRSFAYTLPKNTMRLALQEDKAQLLATLKTRLLERDFCFSFRVTGWTQILKHRFFKRGFRKTFERVAKRNGMTFDGAFEGVALSPKVIKGLKSGEFLPTKTLLFSVALAAHWSVEDVTELMHACQCDWDNAHQKDVVVQYLLQQRIFNPQMIQAAFDEYKVRHIFLE